MTLYFIIGVDQDGDSAWDVTTSLDVALHNQQQMIELCHEPPVIWQVETNDLDHVLKTSKIG